MVTNKTQNWSTKRKRTWGAQVYITSATLSPTLRLSNLQGRGEGRSPRARDGDACWTDRAVAHRNSDCGTMDKTGREGRDEAPPQAEKLSALMPAGRGESVLFKGVAFGGRPKRKGERTSFVGLKRGWIWEEFQGGDYYQNIIKIY